MDIREFKNKIFENAKDKGFEKYEIYYSNSSSFSVTVYKGKVEKYLNSSSEGVSFRGIYNGSMGYSYSETISEDIIDTLTEGAKQNAVITDSDEPAVIYDGDESYPELSSYYENINEKTAEEKIELAKELEQYVLSYDDRIKQSTGCVIANGEGSVYIANSCGLELERKINNAVAYASAIAEKDGITKTSGELWAGFDWSELNTKKIAETAAKEAVNRLNAKSVRSGKQRIVIKNKTFAELLSCFLPSFFAENVQKGLSLFSGKLNEKIAADCVNLADDPLMKKGYASTPFDSEGVACFNKTLIENGTLKMFLYNLKSAQKDNTRSTGNGERGSFKGSVSTDTSNCYIKNGKSSPEYLFGKAQNGLYITDLNGLHSGTNGISGDFSLSAEGY
ncbi:MAG: TldD/PmbA family protein, partial [Firmicutes bacterium]|nr:TldD/PmbA family protein [Bacillota bacterium]